MKRSSRALVSSVPATMTTGGPDGNKVGLGAAVVSILPGLADAMRAVASMRAFGAGSDHRVGGVGFET